MSSQSSRSRSLNCLAKWNGVHRRPAIEHLETRSFLAADVGGPIPLPPGAPNQPPVITSTPLTQFHVSRFQESLLVTGAVSNDVKEYSLSGDPLRDVVQPNAGRLSAPQSLQIGPDGLLYVGDNNSVKKFNPLSGAFLGNFATGFDVVGDIEFDSHGSVFVSDYGNAAIKEYTLQGELLNTFELGTRPSAIQFISENTLLVALTVEGPRRNTLAALNVDTGALTSQSSGWSQPLGVVVGPDGRYYGANFTTATSYGGLDPDTIYVVDPAGGAARRWDKGSGQLFGAVNLVFADGDLFVTSYYNGKVVRFDGATGNFVSSFFGPEGPNGLLLAQPVTYRYRVAASDADNDALQYSLATAPAGMQINASTGAITWAPSESMLGDHRVVVNVNDGHGGVVAQTFVVSVFGANDPPTQIALSNDTLSEDAEIGTVVGNLTTTDPDAGDAFSYRLASGAGSADNAKFRVVGNQLVTAAKLDYEAKSSYSVLVRSTDRTGYWVEKAFTITVTNVTLPGDTNGDDKVDFADFAVLRANFGIEDATLAKGDFNDDGVVSIADFAILRANFGRRV